MPLGAGGHEGGLLLGQCRTSASVSGSPSSALRAAWSSMQRTAVDRPTPRVEPDEVERSNTEASMAEASWGTSSTPDAPGPPGLTNSEPMRSPGELAARRASDLDGVPSGQA
ncbi:MAG: hypothetical protein R2755_20175 [Acidimicrobiales bacterium]